MSQSIYTITAQTNLHAGSGDANYGIIDKLVQRDTLTGLPCVHASSLKGSILQHFFNQEGMTDEYIDIVFGGQTSVNKRKSNTPRDKSKTGEYVFMQAQLLSIPIRSNLQAFYEVTCPRIINELATTLENLGFDKTLYKNLYDSLNDIAQAAQNSPIVLGGVALTNCKLEDKKYDTITACNIEPVEFLKLGMIVVPNKDFDNLTDNHHLPVIARNHLENGQSTNLWYEQVLPRQTKFYFAVLKTTQVKEVKDFDSRLTDCTEKKLVQIGANATVGYGYCKISKIL